MASQSRRSRVTHILAMACLVLIFVLLVLFPLVLGFARLLPGAVAKDEYPYPNAKKGGTDAVLEWSRERIKWGEGNFTAWGGKRQPSPETWHKEVVYYVLVDRFANGDLSNDKLNIPSYQKEQIRSGSPYDIATWRHGGDLEGLRNRLGYIKEMGATSIWLSPILYNNKGDYHGYALSDAARVDPGFGNERLLRKVVHEAHELGLKVILDVVINMMKSQDMKYEGNEPSIDKTTECAMLQERQYWNSTAPPEHQNQTARTPLEFGLLLPDYMRSQEFFVRCGFKDSYRPLGVPLDELNQSYEQEAVLKDGGDLWPEFFETSSLELDTMHPALQELWTNLLIYWIAYADIDGLRLDAAQHVSADFSSYISTHARAYAKSIGKEDFYIIGELDINAHPFPYLYLGHIPQSKESAQCSAHEHCVGLSGNCCPADNGLVLACCNENAQIGGMGLGGKAVPQLVRSMAQQLEPTCDELNNATCPGLPTCYPSSEMSFIRDVADGTQNASYWFSDQFWIRGMNNVQRLLSNQGNLGNAWVSAETQDTPRVLSLGKGEQGSDAWRLIAAMAWSFTWYGIPTVNNGVEMAFNGLCQNSGSNANFLDPDMDEAVARSIMEACNYSAVNAEATVNQGFWRQDMFSGGPLLLGSAVESINDLAMIKGRMAEAIGPHWCEEPILDRSPGNEVYQVTRALSRIRRSCAAVRENRVSHAEGSNPQQLAYWKETSETDQAALVLVLLTFIEKPYWTSTKFVLPPGADYAVGQKFIDMIHPHITAVVVDNNGSSLALEVNESDPQVYASVFAPDFNIEMDEYAHWYRCKNADMPQLPDESACVPTMQIATWMGLSLWCIIALAAPIAFCTNCCGYSGVYLCLVTKPSPVEAPKNPTPLPADVDQAWPKHVFVAAIEHTIPERKVKVSAGGLGKVLDQMLREHPPGVLSLVHPMVGGVNYGEMTFFSSVEVLVDMQKQTVSVHKIEAESHGIKKRWYILEHPWFGALTTGAPYPYPQTKLSVLRFFSLWNQVCAELMSMLEPDIYHCMDYHAALVPLYMRGRKLVPTIIVLHNADYDGAVETDFITDVLWQTVHPLRRLSLIFNLEVDAIRKYLQFEGRFNMLWGAITSIEETQAGFGVCTVSGNYAAELKRERTMFKALPEVLALDNAIDGAADDGPKSTSELVAARRKSKKMLQEFCGLEVDDRYKILIFVGRWVKQKGVDNIALRAPSIMDNNPDVQFVLAGPPGDPYGSYAQELLRPLVDEYPGRLFVVTEFFMIPKEARAGAHFCLMPSISEPFGYVDVEFGLVGVPSLGCAIGGLGKMPGVYFRQQNSDSSDMLLAGYTAAVEHALNMPEDDYWEMAFNCISAQFPFSIWRENLMEIYRKALVHFDEDAKGNNEDLTLDDETGYNVLKEHRYQSVHDLQRRKRKGSQKHRSAANVAHQLQKLQVSAATEFLNQPVSEDRIREIMREWMATAQDPDTDAETLQAHISLQNERNNEGNVITRTMMGSCMSCKHIFEDSCLRIHVVIALGYILSPVIDIKQNAVVAGAEALDEDFWGGCTTSSIMNLGSTFGCFFWLMLSRQVPAYLLMAGALFCSLLFFFASQSIGAASAIFIDIFAFLSGTLASSRLLFLVWNFSEDFHGGFQVGARRVALVESLRSALQWALNSVSAMNDNKVLKMLTEPLTYLYMIVIIIVTILIMLAPNCYQSCVLPHTNFMKELRDHKVYLLLMTSLSFSSLASFPANNSKMWLSANGWSNNEQAEIDGVTAVLMVIVLTGVFMSLHKMSVWGPWAIRDFTCLVPPGSLLRVLAFYELGHLHYKSWLFVAVLTISYIMDTARYAAFWTAILTTLANKWYAIFGGFTGLAVVSFCMAPSPFVTHLVGRFVAGVSPTFSSIIANHPQMDIKHLQWAGLVTVWLLDGIAYCFQIASRKYFINEVLTFKGHGHLMPDGSVGWPGSSMSFVSARSIKMSTDQGDVTDSSDSDSEDESSGYGSA